MFSDIQSILFALGALTASIGSLLYVVFNEGRESQKGKQAQIDNEALQKEVALNAENTQIEERVDSLPDDGVDSGMQQFRRNDADL